MTIEFHNANVLEKKKKKKTRPASPETSSSFITLLQEAVYAVQPVEIVRVVLTRAAQVVRQRRRHAFVSLQLRPRGEAPGVILVLLSDKGVIDVRGR